MQTSASGPAHDMQTSACGPVHATQTSACGLAHAMQMSAWGADTCHADVCMRAGTCHADIFLGGLAHVLHARPHVVRQDRSVSHVIYFCLLSKYPMTEWSSWPSTAAYSEHSTSPTATRCVCVCVRRRGGVLFNIRSTFEKIKITGRTTQYKRHSHIRPLFIRRLGFIRTTTKKKKKKIGKGGKRGSASEQDWSSRRKSWLETRIPQLCYGS